MKKEVSERDKKLLALLFRWRWALTFCAALNVWFLVDHYKRHDVTGWSMPNVWVLPWLTFGCAGFCVFIASVWVAYFYKPRFKG